MCLRRHSSAALCFSVSLLNLPSLSFPSCVICLALPFLLPPRSAVISVVVLFLVWLGSEKLSCFCPPSYFAGTDSALLELPSELLLWQQCPSTAAHAPRTKCISSCRCVNIHSNCRFFASTSSHTRRVHYDPPTVRPCIAACVRVGYCGPSNCSTIVYGVSLCSKGGLGRLSVALQQEMQHTTHGNPLPLRTSLGPLCHYAQAP